MMIKNTLINLQFTTNKTYPFYKKCNNNYNILFLMFTKPMYNTVTSMVNKSVNYISIK